MTNMFSYNGETQINMKCSSYYLIKFFPVDDFDCLCVMELNHDNQEIISIMLKLPSFTFFIFNFLFPKANTTLKFYIDKYCICSLINIVIFFSWAMKHLCHHIILYHFILQNKSFVMACQSIMIRPFCKLCFKYLVSKPHGNIKILI